MMDLRDIKSKAIDIYRYYLPDISTKKNILCPFHSDGKTKSFGLYGEDDLKFKCFGCGKQGDSIEFIKLMEGYMDAGDAIKKAKEVLGLNGTSKKAFTLQQIKELKPDGYTFQRMHTYKKGNPIYVKAIYKDSEGNKQARYFTMMNNGYLLGRKSEPVLYNQELLTQRPDDIVCYTEGEKDCDTLTELGFLAVTAGSATDFNSYLAHHKAEHFKGRDVVLFPDHDQAGYESVKKIADVLLPYAKSVRRVNLEKAWKETFNDTDMPKGADITDFIERYKGDAKEAIHKLIKDAEGIEKKSLINSLQKGADLINLECKVEWVVDKLVPKQSITLLHGRGGIGKTWLSLILANAVSKGIPFMDLETQQMPVFFVDFENSLPVLVERVKKVGAEEVFFWHNSNEIKPPKLDSGEWGQYKSLPVGLIIFDTLRAAQNKDENSSQEMAFIMNRLKELRDNGFTVFLLHHTPKGDDRTYKGSTAILDLADHVLSLHRVKKGNYEEIEDNDVGDHCYKLGTKDKTRYEPFHIFLEFNPEKGFELSKDPDLELMEIMHDILTEAGNPLKQLEFVTVVREKADIAKSKTEKLIKKGIGIYWTESRETGKRSLLYSPIPISQFPNTIYSQEIRKYPEQQDNSLGNSNSVNSTQSFDNTVFPNFLKGMLGNQEIDEPIFIDAEVELL